MSARRLLIVEDEVIVSMDIASRLELAGYEVVGTAPSAERALRLAASARPDLALMDIHLQGSMDGIEAAIELRRRHEVPVVFLTAHADDATVARARSAEPLGYVLKPFDDRELPLVVERALRRHRTEAGLRRQSRLYAALCHLDATVARAPDPARFEADACELVVRHSELPLVWIARYHADGRLALSACAAIDPALAGAFTEHADAVLAVMPSADAWDATSVRRPDAHDVADVSWQAQARAHNLRDLAVAVLRVDGRVVGLLGLHGRAVDGFGPRELALVEEIADDVSAALDSVARSSPEDLPA